MEYGKKKRSGSGVREGEKRKKKIRWKWIGPCEGLSPGRAVAPNELRWLERKVPFFPGL